MTIAVSIKVNDGIVLATDSASTLLAKNPSGVFGVINVYENANKIFNLHKELPVGIITWGSGSIGKASLATLIKDFRKMIMGKDPDYQKWGIDIESYNIENISKKFKEFIYDEHYKKAFKDSEQKPTIGFLVAGYSSGERMAEEWRLEINSKGECLGPYQAREKERCGLSWNGEPEAITRLYFGFSNGLPTVLKKSGIPDEKIKEIIENCRKELCAPMVFDPMPIQDVIDLAIFLVDTTKNFLRFIPGAPTVGGPIEVAAITKHEGYKWVARKFYYEQKYNLRE